MANLTGVVAFASSKIQPDSEANIISSDWLNHFKDYAEKASTSDVQCIWGKILAGEINRPGSFSKRTLSILNDMNAKEADNFNKLCSICVKVNHLRIRIQCLYRSYT